MFLLQAFTYFLFSVLCDLIGLVNAMVFVNRTVVGIKCKDGIVLVRFALIYLFSLVQG